MQTSEEPAAESAPPVSEDVQKLVEHERDATEAAPKKTPRVELQSLPTRAYLDQTVVPILLQGIYVYVYMKRGICMARFGGCL